MSWKGATEIVDKMIEGAEHAALAVMNYYGVEIGLKGLRVALNAEERGLLDNALRPYVRDVSEKLTEQDWDPESGDSYYFDRFAQEMCGYADSAFEVLLRKKLADATHEGTIEEVMEAAQRLKEHTDNMKAGNA